MHRKSLIKHTCTRLSADSSHSDENNDNNSIIAVHGIGAHPDDTWSRRVNISKEGEQRWVNWLEEDSMLPSAVPNARIMRYGYESQWFGESAIQSKVTDVAQRLLRAIGRERKGCYDRPLIFVCHCFGGLVVVQALLEAHNHLEEWPGVFQSTAGLLFLGTTFRGAGGLSQSEMLEAAKREYTEEQIQGETFRILQPGNEFLQYMVDEFGRMRSRALKVAVACFWECKTSNVGAVVGKQARTRFVVNESSGCLDLSESTAKFSLSRTHFDMNKFGNAQEEDFLTVKEVIEDMAAKAPDLILARQSQRNYNS